MELSGRRRHTALYKDFPSVPTSKIFCQVSSFLRSGLQHLTDCDYIAKIDDIMPRPQTVVLSNVHKRILSELSDAATRGIASSVSDLTENLNLAGASSIMPTLRIMERNGFVRILGGGTQGKRLTIVLTTKGKTAIGISGIPILGSIPAGLLAEALEHCEEVVDLGTALPYQTGDFLLVVEGYSMIGDGILSGDRVLLRPNVQVENGEIAAVYFGEQYLATLKHVCFEADGEAVTLRASNPTYADVTIPGQELSVAGVLRGLVRTTHF